MPGFRAFSQKISKDQTDVTLTSPNGQFSILPGNGFKMYSAIYKGRQMIMPTADVSAPGAGNGVPVLFPFPNRHRNCQYSYEGRTYTIKKDGKEMYLHGLLVSEPFEFDFGYNDEKAWCKGWYRITKDSEFFESYPFPCTLTLTYTLKCDGLTLSYAVKNDGDQPLPYGFAIHPYFPKYGAPDAVSITVPATSYYEAEDLLPTGRLLPMEGDFDISKPSEIGNLNLDHVFHGLDSTKESVIAYPGEGFNIGLRASDEFVNMVVYTPRHIPGFCLENQTNATDYLNLHALGEKSACIQVVEPGQSKTGWIFARVF